MVAQVPLIARLTLRALGMAEGRRGVRRALDPVAGWLAREHPRYLAPKNALAAFATIRARSSIIDQLLIDEVERSLSGGLNVSFWTFGGGFDARWYRLRSVLSPVVREFWDVEEVGFMRLKQQALDPSPFAPLWSQVNQLAAPIKTWTLNISADETPIVILEGLAGRMDLSVIERILVRFREGSDRARVLVGLPIKVKAPERWSARYLKTQGWTVEVDVRLADRGRLLNNQGSEVCHGMHGLRVLSLSACPY